MKQNRLKSWALWMALAALIVFGIKEIFHIDVSEPVDTFMDLLLPVLVGFGIVNNPTDKDNL